MFIQLTPEPVHRILKLMLRVLLKNALNSVSKLKDITSTSSDANSVIFMNFEYGTNLDEASNDIRSSLSFTERFIA